MTLRSGGILPSFSRISSLDAAAAKNLNPIQRISIFSRTRIPLAGGIADLNNSVTNKYTTALSNNLSKINFDALDSTTTNNLRRPILVLAAHPFVSVATTTKVHQFHSFARLNKSRRQQDEEDVEYYKEEDYQHRTRGRGHGGRQQSYRDREDPYDHHIVEEDNYSNNIRRGRRGRRRNRLLVEEIAEMEEHEEHTAEEVYNNNNNHYYYAYHEAQRQQQQQIDNNAATAETTTTEDQSQQQPVVRPPIYYQNSVCQCFKRGEFNLMMRYFRLLKGMQPSHDNHVAEAAWRRAMSKSYSYVIKAKLLDHEVLGRNGLASAEQLLQEMKDNGIPFYRNCIYECLFRAYGLAGRSVADILALFDDMLQQQGITPTPSTFAKLLFSVVASLRKQEQKQIPAAAAAAAANENEEAIEKIDHLIAELRSNGVDGEFTPELFNGIATYLALVKRDDGAVYGLIEEMKHRGLQPTLWIYNSLIELYTTARDLNKVGKVIKDMDTDGIEMDASTLYMVMKTAALWPQAFISRQEKAERFSKLYNQMVQGFGIKPNLNIFNILIKTCSDAESVQFWFDQLLAANNKANNNNGIIKPNEHTFEAIFHVLSVELRDYDAVIRWFDLMRDQYPKIPLRPSAYKHLIYAHIRRVKSPPQPPLRGEEEEGSNSNHRHHHISANNAILLFNEMLTRGIKPNLATYANMVDLYATHLHDEQEALKVIGQMREHDDINYGGEEEGDDYGDGTSRKADNDRVMTFAYNRLLCLYGKIRGNTQQMEQWLKRYSTDGVALDGYSYLLVTSAYTRLAQFDKVDVWIDVMIKRRSRFTNKQQQQQPQSSSSSSASSSLSSSGSGDVNLTKVFNSIMKIFAGRSFDKNVMTTLTDEHLEKRLQYYYNQMRRLRVDPDIQTFRHVLYACGVQFKDSHTMQRFLHKLIYADLTRARFADVRRALEEDEAEGELYRQILHYYNKKEIEYNNNNNSDSYNDRQLI